jgi:hypothetical protein
MKAKAGTGASERIELQHGLYRIIGARQGDEFRSIGYLGKKPKMSATSISVADAISEVQRQIDDRMAHLRGQRSGDVPCADEFLDGLEAIREKITATQLRILHLHRRHPRGAASLSKLARFVSDADPETEYVRLGRTLGRVLKFAPAPKWLDRSLAAILVIATPDRERDVRARLRLRDPFVAALEAFFPDPGGRYPVASEQDNAA